MFFPTSKTFMLNRIEAILISVFRSNVIEGSNSGFFEMNLNVWENIFKTAIIYNLCYTFSIIRFRIQIILPNIQSSTGTGTPMLC